MVEQIIFNNCLFRSAEQSTTGTVVAYCIAVEYNFRSPLEIFDTVLPVGNICGQWLIKFYLELLASCKLFLVVRSNLHDAVTLGNFHDIGTHKLHTVTCTAPIEAIRLTVHITTYQCIVVQTFYYTEICSVNIYGIVHHTFIQTIARSYQALTAREVCSIGLCGKIASVATERNTETVKSDILAHLCEQAHTLGIKDTRVIQLCILALRNKDTRCGARIRAHGYHTARNKAMVAPGCADYSRCNLLHVRCTNTNVACCIYNVLGVTLKSDTP